MKALEFLYFWLYPGQEQGNAAEPCPSSLPATPTTPRKISQQDTYPSAKRGLHALTESGDVRLRAMLKTTHEAWSPSTPSKPSRTFEQTQLALSRSAAVLSGNSPRREVRVALRIKENSQEGLVSSSNARGHSLSASRSSTSLSPPRRSPSAGRRAIMGSSASSMNPAPSPPRTPTREKTTRQFKRFSTLRTVALPEEGFVESYLFKAPKVPTTQSPTKSVPRSASNSHLHLRHSDSASTGSVDQFGLAGRPPLVSRMSPQKARYTIATEDLPGSAGATKGLFAPSRRTSITGTPTLSSTAPPITQQSVSNPGTRERRRQVLGKYIGNVDQLLDRFEQLRCSTNEWHS